MSKIKKLLVCEMEHMDINKIYKIYGFQETDLRTSQRNDNESFIFHMSAKGDHFFMKQCSYYMGRKQFLMEGGCRVEQRKDVEKWALH